RAIGLSHNACQRIERRCGTQDRRISSHDKAAARQTVSGVAAFWIQPAVNSSACGCREKIAFFAIGWRHIETDRRKQFATSIADEVPLTALDNKQRPLPQFDLPATPLPGDDRRAASPPDDNKPLFTARMLVR